MASQLMFFEQPEFKIEVPNFILNAGVFDMEFDEIEDKVDQKVFPVAKGRIRYGFAADVF